MEEKERIEIRTLEDDARINDYSKQLGELRKDGVAKISLVNEQIASVKRDKAISKAERESTLTQLRAEVSKAREVALKNMVEVSRLAKEAVAYVNSSSAEIEKAVMVVEREKIAQAKARLADQISAIKEKGAKKKAEASSSISDKLELKEELSTIDYETESAIFDAKNKCRTACDRSKAAIVQAYVDRVQKNRALRNGKTNFLENQRLKRMQYRQNFTVSKFLLSNGLYLAIGVFFIVCIILAPSMTGGSNLLTLPNIFTILEQASTRMFYALGVAGLILLAGTDLSIGRMVALGAVMTGLILHPGTNIVKFFGLGPWNFVAMPMLLRVLLALVLSILLCVLFSTFAGLFSARLKMHPFISTLGTQLIIYGLLFYGTTGTPVGSIDSGIKQVIGGRWVLGVAGGELITFPKLIIPAVCAIFVAWFIWNKTTFGKNMYAVGGNSEAASVSGISVFWTTLWVFVMAGVFYGCGSFLEAFRANASAGTGQGYELDAIAACVVGGISFNGGIGKISGAVIGVIIFTGLTYCLTFLGIDTNLQFVFKGFILLAAVALDSVKYLKRK